MKRYFNPYIKTIRKRKFRSPAWLDNILLIMLIIPILLYPFEGNLELSDTYLYQNEPIASSSPQILPNTSNEKQSLAPVLQLHDIGLASWYDYHLPTEPVGEYWSKTHDTCATRGWNRYGRAKVTNLDNGKSVICYINDDGPRDCEYRYKYKLDNPGECKERIIDLSSHAFAQIADLNLGLINVKVELIQDLSTSNK